jgi:hypothetical protein
MVSAETLLYQSLPKYKVFPHIQWKAVGLLQKIIKKKKVELVLPDLKSSRKAMIWNLLHQYLPMLPIKKKMLLWGPGGSSVVQWTFGVSQALDSKPRTKKDKKVILKRCAFLKMIKHLTYLKLYSLNIKNYCKAYLLMLLSYASILEENK